MTTLTLPQVYALAREAGLDQVGATIAAGLAIAESGLRTDAQGDVGIQTSTWGPSIGLWQIRSVKAESGKGTPRDATRLTDPRFNARSMVSISGAGKNWKPWSTYKPATSGYQNNLARAKAAAGDTGAQGIPGVIGDALGNAAGAVGGFLGDAAGAVGGAAADAAKAAAGAAAGAIGATGWARDATGIAVKATFVGAGALLIILGLWRMVLPGAASTIGKVLQ